MYRVYDTVCRTITIIYEQKKTNEWKTLGRKWNRTLSEVINTQSTILWHFDVHKARHRVMDFDMKALRAISSL